eukprot:Clim_evm54s119 gene=Clim_evmTU54s119
MATPSQSSFLDESDFRLGISGIEDSRNVSFMDMKPTVSSSFAKPVGSSSAALLALKTQSEVPKSAAKGVDRSFYGIATSNTPPGRPISPDHVVRHSSSKAVVGALKALQDKITKLEEERAVAQEKFAQLQAETDRYREELVSSPKRRPEARDSVQLEVDRIKQQHFGHKEVAGPFLDPEPVIRDLRDQSKKLEKALADTDHRLRELEATAVRSRSTSPMPDRRSTSPAPRSVHRRDHGEVPITYTKLPTTRNQDAFQHNDSDDTGVLDHGVNTDRYETSDVDFKYEPNVRRFEEMLQRMKVLNATLDSELDRPKPGRRGPNYKRIYELAEPKYRRSEHHGGDLKIRAPFVVGKSTTQSHNVAVQAQQILAYVKKHGAVLNKAYAMHGDQVDSTNILSPRTEARIQTALRLAEDEFGALTA